VLFKCEEKSQFLTIFIMERLWTAVIKGQGVLKKLSIEAS